jgi:uncharacterized protein (DUF488 family)
MTTLLTFGHGEASRSQLMRLLGDAEVGVVVDVRRFPGSRRHPHVAQEQIQHWLPAGGIAYEWEQRLGGRRRVPPDDAGSDPWWRVEAFRAYAAHTRTDEFGAAIRDLLADVSASPEQRVAVMCSESLWWRCHRRLIADVVVLLHHTPVHHLGHDGKLTAHVPAAGARVCPDGLRYDLTDPPG